jgi:UDP-N-acetylglucosamine diphosphorylase / glucose-1-phosphate thymidylyltransferase / UDP-N-acetylgalactosamine diphosphorylase / glucosamine-1-phosphate N-acetyltransferase / galactosamine-1-phosphate N-acetyltransferase
MSGTANAFYSAKDFTADEDFLGIYGDLYLAPGVLSKVVMGHQRGGVTITGLKRDPYFYGALKILGDRVLGIVEKPKPGTAPSDITNAGVYVFPPQVFKHIQKTALSSRGEYEITDTINQMITANIKARVQMLEFEEWLDIGHPWTLLEANDRAMKSLKGSIQGKIEEGANLHGEVYVASSAIVKSGVYIEGPVYIGEGCDVGPNSYIRPGTVLAQNNKVGAGSEVKNSILLNGAHIPHLSYVGDSIIGEKTNFGAGTITANLRFDNKPVKMTSKGQRVDTGRRKFGAVVGDNVQTGINVSIHPGVIIGNNAWIEPGSVVTVDVPEGVIFLKNGSEKPKTY